MESIVIILLFILFLAVATYMVEFSFKGIRNNWLALFASTAYAIVFIIFFSIVLSAALSCYEGNNKTAFVFFVLSLLFVFVLLAAHDNLRSVAK